MDNDLFTILRGYASLSPLNTLGFPSHIPFIITHNFLLHDILLSPHFLAYPPSKQYQKRFWKLAIQHLETCRTNDDEDDIDTRLYDHYLQLLPHSGPAAGSSQAEIRSQICGKGLPLLQPPPSQSYVTHFWKLHPSIAKTPSNGKHFGGLTRPSTIDVAEYYKTTLFESRTMIESGTTGLRTWFASFVLSQHLISHPEIVQNKRILELGSGVGFLGIIIASLQLLPLNMTVSSTLPSLWLTDIDENVLSRCRNNVNLPCNLSSAHLSINYRIIDWSAALDESTSSPLRKVLNDDINADLVIGSDIVFDPSLIPALTATLKLALQTRVSGVTPTALISLTVRNEMTIGRFLDVARDSNLVVTDVAIDFDRSTFTEMVDVSDSHQQVKIFRMTLGKHC